MYNRLYVVCFLLLYSFCVIANETEALLPGIEDVELISEDFLSKEYNELLSQHPYFTLSALAAMSYVGLVVVQSLMSENYILYITIKK